HVEPDRADVERPAVEPAQVEGVPSGGAGGVADLLPQPLANLVRRRLSGPPEVAVELEGEELLGHVRVGDEERPCLLRVPRAAAPLLGGGLAEVDADVEDDA